MKIIGFIYSNGSSELVLKGDSCLLNGRKPLFIPDWTERLAATPCVILRVSRLGKEINVRFAHRYYDAIAPGMDFVAMDMLQTAKEKQRSWAKAIGFDYSLAIGEWCSKDSTFTWSERANNALLLSPEQAIAEASKWMTIRQGDIIYIQLAQEPQDIQPEQILTATCNEEQKLYCKIK